MPHTEPQLSLRQLVRAFTDGQIDLHTYRSRRARILDELAAKGFSQPSPPIQPDTVRVAHNPQTASATSKPPIVLIISIVVLVLLITILGFRLVMSPKDQPEEKENALPEQPTTTIHQETDLKEGIMAFVKNNAWDDASRKIPNDSVEH